MPISNPAASGAVELLANQVFSNVAFAEIPITPGSPSLYSKIVLEILYATPATNDVQIGVQLSTGGVYADSGYVCSGMCVPVFGQATEQITNSNMFTLTGNASTHRAANTSPLIATLEVFGPFRTGITKRALWQSNFVSQNPTYRNCEVSGAGSCSLFTGGIDGIRALSNSGNISGQFVLYGYKGVI